MVRPKISSYGNTVHGTEDNYQKINETEHQITVYKLKLVDGISFL